MRSQGNSSQTILDWIKQSVNSGGGKIERRMTGQEKVFPSCGFSTLNIEQKCTLHVFLFWSGKNKLQLLLLHILFMLILCLVIHFRGSLRKLKSWLDVTSPNYCPHLYKLEVSMVQIQVCWMRYGGFEWQRCVPHNREIS